MKKPPSDFAVALLMKRMKDKGKPASDEADEDAAAEEETDEAPIAPTAEAAAFKKFRAAITGGDDAKGAAAFKQLLEACGAYEGADE